MYFVCRANMAILTSSLSVVLSSLCISQSTLQSLRPSSRHLQRSSINYPTSFDGALDDHTASSSYQSTPVAPQQSTTRKAQHYTMGALVPSGSCWRCRGRGPLPSRRRCGVDTREALPRPADDTEIVLAGDRRPRPAA